VIGLNKEGDVMYFLSTWPSKSPMGFTLSNDLVIPGQSRNLSGYPNWRPMAFWAHLCPGFDVIFFIHEYAGGYGEEDLYITTRDSVGRWLSPVNLEARSTRKGLKFHPSCRRIKTIYFSSTVTRAWGTLIFSTVTACTFLRDWSLPKNVVTNQFSRL